MTKTKTNPESHRKGRQTSNYPEEEDKAMIHYLAERAKQSDVPLVMTQIWNDFKDWSGTERSVKGLNARFRRLICKNVHLMTHYDLETRIRILFVSRSRVEQDFFEQISRDADVTLSQSGTITEYKKEGGMHLTTPTKKSGEEDGETSRKKRKIDDDVGKEDESDDNIVFDDTDQFPLPIKLNKLPKLEKSGARNWEADDFDPIEEQDNFSEYKPLFHLPPVMPTYQTSRNSQGHSDMEPGTSSATSEAVDATDVGQGAGEVRELMTVMKDFVSMQTQWMKTQMIKESTPSTSQQSQQPETVTASKKGFLHLLKSLVLGLDRPELDNVRSRITRQIETIGDGDEKLPIDTVEKLLDGVLDGIEQ